LPEALSVTMPLLGTVLFSYTTLLLSNDQLQVPSGLAVTVPTEALRLATSRPGSVTVPLLVAVWPSLTTTDALAAVSDGARLFAATAMVLPATKVPSSLLALAPIV